MLLTIALVWGCDDTGTGPGNIGDESAPFAISVDTLMEVTQGGHCLVDVVVEKADGRLHKFDLRIAFDVEALTFLEVRPADLESCGWEYLNYRYDPPGCGDEGPSGLVSVTGLADDPSILGGPDWTCFDTLRTPYPLVTLDFLTSSAPKYEGTFEPVRFYWCECDDNTLVFTSEDRPSEVVGLAREVTDGPLGRQAANKDSVWFRSSGPPDSCFQQPGNTQVRAAVDFRHGGLSFAPVDSIDPRCPPGDVNCDGEPANRTDYELFRDYFCHGESVFLVNRLAQIKNTSYCPGHGPLTLADLLTLKSAVDEGFEPIMQIPVDSIEYVIKTGTISLRDTVTALYIEFANPTYIPPESDDPPVSVCTRNDTCRVLVGDLENPMSLSGDLVRIGGRLTKLDAATSPYTNVELVPGIVPW
jgi:hypothetical protein